MARVQDRGGPCQPDGGGRRVSSSGRIRCARGRRIRARAGASSSTPTAANTVTRGGPCRCVESWISALSARDRRRSRLRRGRARTARLRRGDEQRQPDRQPRRSSGSAGAPAIRPRRPRVTKWKYSAALAARKRRPAAYQARRPARSDGASGARRSCRATVAIDPIAVSAERRQTAPASVTARYQRPHRRRAERASNAPRREPRASAAGCPITAATDASEPPARSATSRGGNARSRTRKNPASTRKPAPPARERSADEFLFVEVGHQSPPRSASWTRRPRGYRGDDR